MHRFLEAREGAALSGRAGTARRLHRATNTYKAALARNAWNENQRERSERPGDEEKEQEQQEEEEEVEEEEEEEAQQRQKSRSGRRRNKDQRGREGDGAVAEAAGTRERVKPGWLTRLPCPVEMPTV